MNVTAGSTPRRAWSRARRTAFAVLLVGVASAGCLAGSAVAAPVLGVDVGHQFELAPGEAGQLTVAVGNIGDSPTSAPIDLTLTLPAGLTATAARDTNNLLPTDVWSCAVAPDGREVSCNGPHGFVSVINPGQDPCQRLTLPMCPVVVDVDVAADVTPGVVEAELEACGGGTAECASATDRIRILAREPFASRYGAAAINDNPDAVHDVPALSGERHAYWAGACDRGAHVGGFGDDLAASGGVGSRPPEILVPTNTQPAQNLSPAPATADHCIDWGALAAYGSQARIWQRVPYGVVASNLAIGQFVAVGNYAPSWRLPAERRAGSHPDGTTMFAWERGRDAKTDGNVDNISVDLPPGFVGNPEAVPTCSGEQFRAKPLACPPETQVGVLRMLIEAACLGGSNHGCGYDTTYPVYNLEPRPGKVAELGFGYASGEGAVTVRLIGRARTDGDYGITAFVGQIPAALVPVAQTITLWGVPWAAENNIWRAKLGQRENQECNKEGAFKANQYIPPGGLRDLGTQDCRAAYDPSWGEIKPFLTNETDCNPAPTVRLATDAFQFPGATTAEGYPDLPDYPQLAPATSNWKTYQSVSPSVTGCADLDFAPDIDFTSTSRSADGATGLRADLSVPQNNTPPAGVAHDPGVAGDPEAGAPGHWRSDAGRATAHLKDTVVTLPDGLSVNPSGAAGLDGCDDAEIGVRGFDSVNGRPLFNNGDPFNKDGGADGAECPDGSKIGTARVDTPLLAEPLTGDVVLGTPKSTDPTSGEMFRLFIVARAPERGLIAKIYGSATANPNTGQLTTTFKNNPEVPFDRLSLDIKGGSRGMLATPPRCGAAGWATTFTPWSGGSAVNDSGRISVDQRCGFGFNPTVVAGTTPRTARDNAKLDFQLTRLEGDQTVQGLTVEMPTGLLASVRGVPLCSSAAAAAGNCPAGSRIGFVDGAAGSGTPFVLERKGDVYLTEGYKGAPYGLLVKVPVEAGPFRGATALRPITVRAAVHVDRRTAQVTTVSDPLPQIWHGVPLRVRQITVVVDRPGFMLNPSDCSPKQVQATILSAEGTRADVANHFQVTNCAALPFKPRIALRLKGRRQAKTGGHPAVRARVRQQGVGEAGIERAEVRLPKSLALDPDNAQALCEFEDGTKPDLEDHCPKGSIVGRARAVTPLLKEPLVGDVYFVKNIRIDEETGNEIRTLPMIVVALRGEIAINLRGESSVDRRNRLVNTFANVPDAPISRFNLNIKGGRNGILTVTRTSRSEINLCKARRLIAVADVDGHNGKRADQRIRVRKPCPKGRPAPVKVCRKRTNNKRALRRCVVKVKRNRAQIRRKIAKRKAAKRQAARGSAQS